MPQRPKLVPSAPTRGPEVPVAGSPFWIGTAADAGIRLFLPGIAARHVSILEREDGFWVSPARAEAAPRVNGQPSPAPRRLRHGDLLELAPGVVYRFDTGAAPPAAPPPPRRAPRALDAARAEPPRRRQGGLVDRKSRRARWLRRSVIGAAVLLGAAAVVLAVSTLRRREQVRAPLSEADAAQIDSLTLVSYERVERGTALLELGLRTDALREFADAVNVLQASRWGRNPYVRPRILRLEAAIAAAYGDQNVVVPRAYRAVAAAPPPAASASAAPRGSLTQAEFARAVEETQAEFEARFGRRITVTGRDHGEHLMLYGVGGAMDLRVRDLSREQIAFAIQAFNRRGVRVKDFSDDRVLQQQVASALRRNRPELMGTGLHMHIDRFANRWDRWTTK